MGIKHLRSVIHAYYNAKLQKSNRIIRSTVCYIDCTSKIVYNANNMNKNINNKSPIELIENIVNKSVEAIAKQINRGFHYNKFILVFDLKSISDINPKFELSQEIIDQYVKLLDTNKESMASIPMLPKIMDIYNTDVDSLKLSVRNLYEVRWNYWSPNKQITNYTSIRRLLKTETNPDVIDKLNTLYKSGIERYILFRGAKYLTKHARLREKNMSTDIVEKLFKTDAHKFDKEFRKYLLNAPYNLIISLTRRIVDGIINSTPDKDVSFLGCEHEADFVIRNHIKHYHSNACPTIYTCDSDIVMLMCDVNCVVKIPYEDVDRRKFNISIYPIEFWKWILRTNKIDFKNIVTICCLLGTDYNTELCENVSIEHIDDMAKYYVNNLYEEIVAGCKKTLKVRTQQNIVQLLTAIEILIQSDRIETVLHHIKPEDAIDLSIVNLKFSNIYTDLLLK